MVACGRVRVVRRIIGMQINWVSVVQGTFYVLTGIWPLVHMRSFLIVTGPKTDLWLVKTVAGLIVAIGASLLVGASETNAGLMVLGVAAALALGTVDVYYAAKGTIRKVYLLDSLVEIVFIGCWIAFALMEQNI